MRAATRSCSRSPRRDPRPPLRQPDRIRPSGSSGTSTRVDRADGPARGQAGSEHLTRALLRRRSRSTPTPSAPARPPAGCWPPARRAPRRAGELPGESWLAIGLGHVGSTFGEDIQGLRALTSLGASLAGSGAGSSSDRSAQPQAACSEESSRRSACSAQTPPKRSATSRAGWARRDLRQRHQPARTEGGDRDLLHATPHSRAPRSRSSEPRCSRSAHPSSRSRSREPRRQWRSRSPVCRWCSTSPTHAPRTDRRSS